MKRKKGFTLIELIAVLVILAILALIVTPLVMNIIRKAKVSADKRSVDAYGRSVELAIATHLLDTGTFPTDLKNLNVEYTGKTVSCNIMQMKENGGIYLSECSVGTKAVKDSSTEDGWYHYGTRDITNEEYVDMYGLALKTASVAYYNTNGNPVSDYTTLTIDYTGKPVSCDVTVNYDGTIYMTKCKVNNVDVTSDTDDGYYQYGAGHINRYTVSSVGTAYNKNGYGGMAYYTSETCGYVNNTGVYDGCKTDYAQSEVKYVVDAWKTAQAPQATEARLITYEELTTDLGCSSSSCRNSSNSWLYNSNYYWTMSPYNNSASSVWYVYSDGSLSDIGVYGIYYVVRPVITISKTNISS